MRHEKDHAFAGSPNSPIPPPLRKSFGGLSYYEPKPHLRVPARFVAHPDPDVVEMPTSTGAPKEYLNIGHLEFEMGGETLSLQTFWSEASPSLFVPFRDKTSGKETYGAGRYIDIDWEGPDVDYVVDFNLAYNPFCAYSEDFSCPFPPPANWLPVPIEAGEKTFEGA